MQLLATLENRVKKLEAALEWIKTNAGHTNPCKENEYYICEAGCEYSEIARKALEEG